MTGSGVPLVAPRSAPTLVVDARAPYGSGLGRYLRESVVALSRLGRFREIVLVGPAGALAEVRARMAGDVRVLDLPRGRYDLRVPLGWRAMARAHGLDTDAATWFPHWDGAWAGPWDAPGAPPRGRPVTTLHDLIPLEGSGPVGRLKAAVADRWMRRMVASSRVLVTASAHTRDQFAARFPEAAATLRVIPHGVAEGFLALAPVAAPTGVPYLLCVANKKPHKRLEVAIETLGVLAREAPTLRLVLIGERFGHEARLRAVAERCGVVDRVDDRTGVSDPELAAWYAGATAVLVPSRAEGFGMVPLEAMACGAPVVALAYPPVPEVVGDAAVVVPAAEAAVGRGADAVEGRRMADAVRRLLAEPAWRHDRVTAGRARAARFTWARSASALADALLFDETSR